MQHGKCIFKQNALLFPIAAEKEHLVFFFIPVELRISHICKLNCEFPTPSEHFR